MAPLEDMYVAHAEAGFDLNKIRSSGIRIAYDAMYGAGQRAMLRLLPDAVALHCDYNPSFKGQAPEPIGKNLKEFAELIRREGNIGLGIANDGDADRIGLFDSKGEFVDSHHILLLLLYYLHHYKGESGDVVVSFSVSEKLKNLADQYGLQTEITKIGFKYIAEIMTQRDVLVAGEESGGLAVKGHIPERDGIWIGLMIAEFMATTGKSLEQLISEVYALVGSFWYDRDDLHITESLKQSIISKCTNNEFKSFGDETITSIQSIDGFKFFLGEGRWIMIRPSGTEPVLRVYAQGRDKADTRHLLEQVKNTIL